MSKISVARLSLLLLGLLLVSTINVDAQLLRSNRTAVESEDDGTPFDLSSLVEPSRPSLNEEGIGDDHFNISVVPGEFDSEEQRPVGSRFYAKVRGEGETDWKIYDVKDNTLWLTVDGLSPGTRYEVETVSVQTDARGAVHESESRIHRITTTGMSQNARIYMILAVLLLALLLLIVLCILCAYCCRNRGQKYPVSKKERMQGRELIISKERGFADYGRPDDDEQRSLTGSRTGESETDSMAEYGDGDPGRFTEDGSFITAYRKGLHIEPA